MSRSIVATIAFLFLVFCFSLSAQNHRAPLLTATASGSSVRYAGFGEVREMRLEIFDDRGQPLFDSAFTSGNLLDYTLIDNGGARLGDGSYLFIVTIRDFAGGESRKFGTFAIADPRVMLENATPDNLSPAQLAAIGSRAVMPIDRIGIEMPSQLQPQIIIAPPGSERDKPVTPAGALPRADVAGTGTVNQVTKWTDTMGTLADSAISEVAGKVGIGTTAPGAQLHIFGLAGQDVFAGMGPNVSANGTGFNFGYAGNSFGLGAGFFNVRPAPGAIAPNPSLRFETGNVQRMIITNIGRVGIGTTNPAQLLDVNGSVKVSGAGTLIFSDNTSMSTAGATLGANTFSGSQTVNGDVTATGTINGVTGSFNDVTASGFVNATSQYNLGASRVLAMPSGGSSLVVGQLAGAVVTGPANTFVGRSAGTVTTTGSGNSFFGYYAGLSNVSGSSNAYFGATAGQNAIGGGNSFFGASAGFNTTSGGSNTFVGRTTGNANTTGGGNSFFGYSAGQNNVSGGSNTFIGNSAGNSATTESSNTLIGGLADIVAGITNATALGAFAQVTQSNSLVLGSVAGANFATQTVKVGIGTTAPTERLEVAGNLRLSGASSGLYFPNGSVMTAAGATLGANSFTGSQSVTGDVNATGNVNASGDGNFNILNANTQYNLNTQRVLAMPSVTTLIVGTDAGAALTSGDSNTFVGGSAGSNTTTGFNNSFFGYGAGSQNISGFGNSFFGTNAGHSATGGTNSFFGVAAGSGTSTGGSNTFVGYLAGFSDGAGGANAYFGYGSGQHQAGGSSNTYIGGSTGTSSISGDSNTLLGGLADVSDGISNATAIGALAMVTQSDSLVLGSVDGINFANTTARVGIGTTAPKTRLQVDLGDVYISGTGSPATGLILRSSDGSACRRLTIDNAGNLILVSLTCP